MIDAVFFSIAVVTFAAAAFKLRDLRRGPVRAGQRALCLLLVTLGLSFVVLSDTAQAVESLIFPNLGRLLSNICTLVVAFGIVAHLIGVSLPAPRAQAAVRRLAFAYLLAIATMAAAFLASPVPARVGDFGDLYRDKPGLVLYTDIFVVMLGRAMVALLLLSLRYSRHAHRAALRFGLWSVASGAVIALVYLTEKFIFVQSTFLGVDLPLSGHDGACPSVVWPVGCLFSVTFPAVGALLIVVGMTVPTWGPMLTAPLDWWKDRRLHTRLEPLWRLLYEEFPQIVMPGTAHLDSRWRLQRRVIEIRDGLTALTPYRNSAARTAAEAAADTAKIPAPERAAVIEATLITLALTERRKNNPAAIRDEPAHSPTSPADLTSDARQLADIAAALPSVLTLQQVAHV
ncbi:hypothetical protein EDD29_5780 [Actinocorallia herbida]|uniref:DUF6545 domain-containing protein n=1 Tax=Actinocorallia herbida TaxID=58109 RepID=A0A3N1D3N9_9ACTN|nr:MAB_1171c family putative transporter [Actinocorallia herbida]ROO88120.1 hypothetical protein EDD29_5780 [Actinocorallia herbida]